MWLSETPDSCCSSCSPAMTAAAVAVELPKFNAVAALQTTMTMSSCLGMLCFYVLWLHCFSSVSSLLCSASVAREMEIFIHLLQSSKQLSAPPSLPRKLVVQGTRDFSRGSFPQSIIEHVHCAALVCLYHGSWKGCFNEFCSNGTFGF